MHTTTRSIHTLASRFTTRHVRSIILYRPTVCKIHHVTVRYGCILYYTYYSTTTRSRSIITTRVRSMDTLPS